MRFKHKLHYILKYLVLALPIILLLLMSFSKDNDVYNNNMMLLADIPYDFLDFTNSDWYIDLLNILNIDHANLSTFSLILCVYPLYVFYVYLFDLILDIICFLPKFLHDLFYDLMEKGKF